MKRTVFGVVASRDGLASADGRYWSSPASMYSDEQDPQIPVDRAHDRRQVGTVIYLERDRADNLWAVAHVDPSVTPTVVVRVGGRDVPVSHPLFWSAERIQHPDDGVLLLRSLALTSSPARLGATPVKFLPGEIDYRGVAASRWADRLEQRERDLIERAADSFVPRRYDFASPLRIRSLAGIDPETAEFWERNDSARYRSPAPVAGSGTPPVAAMRQAGPRGSILSVR